MKFLKSSVLATVGAVAIGFSVGPVYAQAAKGQPTIPIEAWALRDVVDRVQISPDGKHVLVQKLESKEGKYLLEIYSTDDMSKPLRRLNAEPMEIISASWVSDNFIFGTAWQQNRSKVNGPEELTFDYKAFSYNLSTNKFKDLPGNFGVANILPKEPNTILISSGTAVADQTGVDPFEAFRPRSYYRFNLESGARKLVLKGSEKYPTAEFDDVT